MFAAATQTPCQVIPAASSLRAGLRLRLGGKSLTTAPRTTAAAARANPFTAAARASAANADGAGGGGGGALLLIGFHEDEVEPLAELVGALAEDMEVGRAGDMAVARVAGDALALSAEALLGIPDVRPTPPPSPTSSRGEHDAATKKERAEGDVGTEADEEAPSSSSSAAAAAATLAASLALPPATRCVLLWGDAARALMPDLRLEMCDAGFAPSVFGAFTPAHAGKPLAHVAAAVIKAHERYWDLAGDPAERASDACAAGHGDGDGDGSPGDTAGEPPLTWAVSTAWAGEEGWKAADVTVAMSVAVDMATVLDPPASQETAEQSSRDDLPTREDMSNIVALDGVVGDALRAALLDAVTQTDWPHDTADSPPTPKWTRETNDGISSNSGGGRGRGGGGTREGAGSMEAGPQLKVAPNSWGLGEEALEEVGRSAPVRAFLARLGALYPEYHVRTMPADALEPDGVPGAMSSARDGGDSRVATVVANAAVYGDDFRWHLDMDPGGLDPTSPFAERFGSYVNRSVGRPLFVSALVYLNGPRPWTPGMDAETLFLDPGTGTGVFVRPAPGRVLLMDQDVLHRVSTPSQSAGVPRYSLVLKLCFYPKSEPGDGGGGDGGVVRPTLARSEWGAPLNFGTAGGRSAPPELLGEVFSYDDDEYDDE